VGHGPAVVAERLAQNPLITPKDVRSSATDLEVVCAFNPGATRLGNEYILLVRVAERPLLGVAPSLMARKIDLTGPEPIHLPIDPQDRPEDLVGLPVLDVTIDPPVLLAGYLRRDTPGLSLVDPRDIKFNGRSYLSQVSHLRVARSTDGIRFTIDDSPALAPGGRMDEYGCEDPRITLIGETYYVTYVTPCRYGITTSLASTRDFHRFERHGVIMEPDNKDVVIFPDKCRGRYVALTRPMPQSFGKIHGIWVAFSDDLLAWRGHTPTVMPRAGMWDELRTGASAVPFRVPEGWLELYHGVDRTNRYCMGAVLLDGDDPRRVLARSPEPILQPEADFEQQGFFGNVVLSCGHVALDDEPERIRLYYGAADSVTSAADFSVAEILASLR
jgi:predicted GH43/DUF377 family glycosyl hydrolase